MLKFIKSHVLLTICLILIFVALISWFAFDWGKRPSGFIELLGVVIPPVLGALADLISILKDTRVEKAGGTTVKIKIAANGQNNGQIIGQQTIIYPPAPVPDQPQALPDLPARGLLPPVGPLPAGSRMMYARNACFTGREEDLLALADALLFTDEAHRVTVTQALAATGLGGMGKTQLAVEFCYRYGRYYEGVHWLNCRDGGLEGEIAECGRGMNLPYWPEKQPEQAAATLRVWEGSSRRLLVLDNLEDPAALRDWLPRLSRCRLLVTARRADWPADLGVQTHPLGMLPPDESRTLLRTLAPRLTVRADAELDAIAAKLGCLPLALDLAGRYLKERERLSPAAYLEALDAQENLLEHSSLLDWVEGSPTKHETSLAATFRLSWEQLAGEETIQTQARRLFLLAGWCAPNAAIPPEILRQASAAGEEDFDRAFRCLYALGLLERMEGGAAIHPLLAAFARSLQTVADRKTNLEDLAKTLADLSSQANQSGLPEKFRALRPHLEILAQEVEKVDPAASAPLWNNLGNFLHTIADLKGALVCHERALRIDEAVYGADYPEVATDVNDLGLVLKEQGELDKARGCFERALRIDEAVYGADHPEVAININNLGGVLQAQGELYKARVCFERALRIDEAAYGADHPEVARGVNYLGRVLQDLGELDKARACFERALRIDEAAYGAGHPAVARDVNNLGSVLQDQGDLDQARACYERALRIDEAVYGADHPNVAIRVNNLGSVLKDLSDLKEARGCFERALRINEAAYGADHPNVAINMDNLGRVLQDLGDLAEARTCCERALCIDEAVYGVDHPAVATVVNNLGLVLQEQGELDKARACFERALRIDEQVYGADHPNVATLVNNLGRVLYDLGDLAEARTCCERALCIDEAVYGVDHPAVATVVNNLGTVLQDQGELDKARACFERALRIDDAAYGADHPAVARDVNNLGRVLQEQGDLKEARACYERALRIFEKFLPRDHPSIRIVLKNLDSLGPAQGSNG